MAEDGALAVLPRVHAADEVELVGFEEVDLFTPLAASATAVAERVEALSWHVSVHLDEVEGGVAPARAVREVKLEAQALACEVHRGGRQVEALSLPRRGARRGARPNGAGVLAQKVGPSVHRDGERSGEAAARCLAALHACLGAIGGGNGLGHRAHGVQARTVRLAYGGARDADEAGEAFLGAKGSERRACGWRGRQDGHRVIVAGRPLSVAIVVPAAGLCRARLSLAGEAVINLPLRV